MTKQKEAALSVSLIHDFIKEGGEQGISSGRLYAMLTGRISLNLHNRIISFLKTTGKIRESNHMLISI